MIRKILLLAVIFILVATPMLIIAGNAEAWRGHGGHYGGYYGPVIGWGPAYVYGPPVFFGPPVYTLPAIPVVRERVYIQGTPPPPVYWYYCRESQAYYPYARECQGGWMQVVPTAPPQMQAAPSPSPPNPR